ncbi:Acetyltransferase [Hexamita inflata]|uniref:N-alpha-acetyltransferase 40 n=1 Tax=Hexamita inflata TaxID=28002 RepID=A0AA86PBA2_9EUKA|nr:Acetyltransferase [Hexamita inflata]
MKYLTEAEKKLQEMNIKNIHPLDLDNYQIYFDIAFANMSKLEKTNKTEMLKSIVSKHSFILEIVENTHLQSFVVFRLFLEEGLRTLYVYEFHVVESQQSRGFGKQMMRQTIEIANQLGMEMIILTCLKVNKRAFNFYVQFNFQLVEWSPTESDPEKYYILGLTLQK